MHILKRLLIFLLLLLLTACTATKAPQVKDAAYWLQEGERLMQKKAFDEAIAAFEKVRESFESPELTAKAELKIAETHFHAHHWLEAALAYEAFIKQHPGHEATADALYFLGTSYFFQLLSPDRDQTAAKNAMATFETLVRQFPRDSRVKEAKKRIATCRNNLIAHEVYVGNFYLRTKQYQAAISRLEGALSLYPAQPFNHDRTYFLLGKAFLLEGQRAKALESFDHLKAQYPSSDFVKKAQELLQKTP